MKSLMMYLCILCLLSGCVETNTIDDINIILAVGLDQSDRKQMMGTFLTDNFMPDKSITNKTYTSKAPLRRDLLIKANHQAAQPLVTGGVSVTVIGEKLGKQGIDDILDIYQGDVTIGARNFFAISEGTAKKILQGQYGPEGNGTYLYNLLDSKIKSKELPETNLHFLLRDYYQKGKDIYLPRLKQISTNQIEISGVSLFKKDKEVDVIPSGKLFYFRLLVDKHNKGFFFVPKNKKEAASIKGLSSKHEFILSKKKPSEVTVQITIKGAIQEYTGKNLGVKQVKEIQKNLEKKVEKECLQLVKSFQKNDTDPMGLGAFYKSRNRGFDYEKWAENYKNLNIKVVCRVTIEEPLII
ncbi:Ger(x)C family spore germination protein [Peribacillus huizhouensis]|uniref:Spore germination protein n=1 Tax=Peribacillus huizhouensis TaxID=1501239 RepID=A0ABR6CQT8_9BACI|nr:Ger(x)C family spore germination protein [Peribacillus huizhouensis]MBA9027309.1 spore germination protein [Peribacillus huizhouensis]